MAGEPLSPICFLVMPFGTKETGLALGEGPSRIDFDSLWEKALAPALRQLGYLPVRADKDAGSMIILEMLERLTLADLVVADLSIPNGNVYYEVGFRHATKPTGCVLISAQWSKPLFDAAQMRRVTYPLPETVVTDEQAAEIQRILVGSIDAMRGAKTPPYCLPGFPNLTESKTTSFQDYVLRLSNFQAQVTAVRKTPSAARPDRVRQLLLDFFPDANANAKIIPSVALELLYLVRDTLGWKDTAAYIARLPSEIQQLPVVQEQQSLAISKTGGHAAAIGALEQLVTLCGDTSERQGLLGGRYKRLYQEATNPVEKARYLSKAIEHYERGMMLDLNDYFPASNLPPLLKLRGRPGDAERAREVANLVEIACRRALQRNPRDEWNRPTRLVASFQTENVEQARRLVAELMDDGPENWKLDSALNDLRAIVGAIGDSTSKHEFEGLISQLEQTTH